MYQMVSPKEDIVRWLLSAYVRFYVNPRKVAECCQQFEMHLMCSDWVKGCIKYPVTLGCYDAHRYLLGKWCLVDFIGIATLQTSLRRIFTQ